MPTVNSREGEINGRITLDKGLLFTNKGTDIRPNEQTKEALMKSTTIVEKDSGANRLSPPDAQPPLVNPITKKADESFHGYDIELC